MVTSIQLLEGSEEDRTIQQTEPLTDIQIHSKMFKSFLPHHAGQIRHLKMITLYVPKNHGFWWNWQNVSFSKTRPDAYQGRRIDSFLKWWPLHSSNGKITCFTCFTSLMCIIESSESWENYSDAYNNALSILEKEGQKTIDRRVARMMEIWVSARPSFRHFLKNGQKKSTSKEYKYKVIYLDNYITDQCFYKTTCVGGPRSKTKIAAKKQGTEWHVELTGVSHKTATFVLDENFEVLDVWGKAVEGPLISEPIDYLSIFRSA